MNFNSKPAYLQDYAEVKDRVQSFYKKYPEGSILTDIVKWEEGVVVMKAVIYRNPEEQEKGIVAATGHAYEREGSSQINKTSALENCETSAVGRALAMLGLDIRKSIASKQEVDNAIHQQTKGDPEPPKTPNKPQNEKGNSEPAPARNLDAFKALADRNKKEDAATKRKEFFAICREKGITEKRQKAIVFAFTQKESRADVTAEEFQTINVFLRKASDNDLIKVLTEAIQLKQGA